MKLHKFNDSNETVINRDNLQLFNKKCFIETRITIKHEEVPLTKYMIVLVLEGKSENLELVLLFKNKKQRDADYNKLIKELSI